MLNMKPVYQTDPTSPKQQFPTKSTQPQSSSSSPPIKFIQYPQCSQPYIPKFKINSKQQTLSLAYIYKIINVNNIQIIGNLEQQNSPTKVNEIQLQKIQTFSPTTNNLISQAKRKGIKQYSFLIRRKDNKKQTQDSTVVINSIIPFGNTHLINYYQIKVVQFVPTSHTENSNNNQEQQYINLSFGITNNSQKGSINIISVYFKLNKNGNIQIYRNNNKIQEISMELQMDKIKQNDTLGCGYIPHMNQVFLTYNGKYLLEKFRIIYPQDLQQKDKDKEKDNKSKKGISQFMEQYSYKFYPFISITSKKIVIQAIFQNCSTNFVFPYVQQLIKYQQKLIQQEIPKKVQISDESIYGLVLNYFKFYGFQKTGQLFQAEMMNRNMKFYPQNQPIKNKLQYEKKHQLVGDPKRNSPFKQKRIKKCSKRSRGLTRRSTQQLGLEDQQLELNSEMSQRNSQQQHRLEQQQVSSMEQFYKLGKSSSLISRRGKKIIDKEQNINENLEKARKKQEEMSFYLNKKKMQKKVEELKRSEQQKFKTQRIQIMKSIKQGKIQKAMKLYTKSFKCTKIIQIFFKAHIFLKYFHQQGLQKVLQYAKKQNHNFTQFQNNLMPFFNHRSLTNPLQPQQQFRPLRLILFLICSQNKHQFNFQRQMEVFAQFISKIICEDIGFFSQSKLQLALQHYKTVQKKVSQFQISIGGVDLEAMDQF